MKGMMLACVLLMGSKGAHMDMIRHYAEKSGVDAKYLPYLMGLAHVESGFENVKEKNPKGAASHGVFQIRYKTGKWLCPDLIIKQADLYDAVKNIRCAVSIFKMNLEKYVDIDQVIASHNSGSPVYCRGTYRFVGKEGYEADCVKGRLLNHEYVEAVKMASLKYLNTAVAGVVKGECYDKPVISKKAFQDAGLFGI